MTYAFAAMFSAFILTSTVLPNWALLIPLALVISEIALTERKSRQ